MTMKFALTWITLLALLQSPARAATTYNVGVGIADATGPAAEINMMGYANPAQVSAGIHTRQYSRAFIIEDDKTRVVFVSVDCGMIDQILKFEVIKRLADKYGDTYTHKNVVLSGTHTHSGPAGFMQYLLFDITSKGWVQQSFESLVDGITLSIERAHDNVKPANIYYTKDTLLEANINRSPAAYLNNPSWERAKYPYNTDKDMIQLKFVATDGQPIGIVNWFAVHPVSMNNTNPYISSDNKGYAEFLFETHVNGVDVMPGKGPFIAAFASTNLGDTSPNTRGARCLDTGLPCDFVESSCNNRVHLCVAFGPGKDMFDSTRIIGQKHYDKAHDMYHLNETEMEALDGPVQFAHQYVNMTEYTVEINDPSSGLLTNVTLCQPAMGYSFAAGTTDGPGAFDFTQGATTDNPFWNMVSSALKEPSEEQKECHAPKPILLNTGEITWPYLWHPKIVETQMLRIGQFLIAAMPGEFTTMAGRRLRDALNQQAVDQGGPANVKTVIAGLSNVYTHYITTFQEYQIQRYEGGSTIYGPHTLSAYIDQYKKLTASMFQDQPLEDGPVPPNLLDDQISLVSGVVFDSAPYGKTFGDVLKQPYPLVRPNETVTATFVSGHPRNDLMLEETFMTVEKQEDDGTWTVIRTDAHFDTIFAWKRTTGSQSEVETRWLVPQDAVGGPYRFRHYGHSKSIDGTITAYNGTSQTFRVG